MQAGSNLISKTAVIYPNVKLGNNIVIEDFCVIGARFKDYRGQLTTIGNDAVIRSHTVIYAGNRIGNGFQTGNKTNIRELNQIGNNVSIGTLSVIEHHVIIGDNVRIHSQAFIPEFSCLKKDCWIGPHVTLTNAKFPRSPTAKQDLKGPVIAENAKIGAAAAILPGIIVGKNSLVGAGSIVTKNVKADSVYAGNPAKYLRKINY